jgi:hypothetical protein
MHPLMPVRTVDESFVQTRAPNPYSAEADSASVVQQMEKPVGFSGKAARKGCRSGNRRP